MPNETTSVASLDALNPHEAARQRVIDLTLDIEGDMLALVEILDRLAAARDDVARTSGHADRAVRGCMTGGVIAHGESLATMIRGSYLGRSLPEALQGRDV